MHEDERIGDEHDERGEGQCPRYAIVATDEIRDERHAGHEAGAHDGRSPADQDAEERNADAPDRYAPDARQSREQSPQSHADDGDIESGQDHDVDETDDPEVIQEIFAERALIADDQAAGQGRLWLAKS